MTLLGGILRLVNISHPHHIVFDETYYVKDAFTLDQFGYATDWDVEDEDRPNQNFIAGDHREMTDNVSYVVHGDVGKWLIAMGMRLFGADNGLGWRFSAAVAGTLCILLAGRIALRMFGSPLLATTAAGFIAVDGVSLVHSRIALLDGFLTLFVLVGFWALLMDYAFVRRRLAHAMATRPHADRDPWGPPIGVRWWLVVGGVALGVAAGVKWSGFYAAAAFGIAAFLFDVAARRAAGVRWPVSGGVMRGGFPAALALVPTTIVTYMATWFSWFAHDGSYKRQWAASLREAGEQVPRSFLPDSLNSWLEYHLQMLTFHSGLDSEHSAASNPFGWLLQIRPTPFFYQEISATDGGSCGTGLCIMRITSVGNPVLWWAGFLALGVILWAAIRHSDWRAWMILAGYAGTYLPWFFFMQRTIFTFYTVAIAPFVALALVYALGIITQRLAVGTRAAPYSSPWPSAPWYVRFRPRRPEPVRQFWFDADLPRASTSEGNVSQTDVMESADAYTQRIGNRVYWIVVVLMVVMAVFFWPVWTAHPVPEWYYVLHNWFPSW